MNTEARTRMEEALTERNRAEASLRKHGRILADHTTKLLAPPSIFSRTGSARGLSQSRRAIERTRRAILEEALAGYEGAWYRVQLAAYDWSELGHAIGRAVDRKAGAR